MWAAGFLISEEAIEVRQQESMKKKTFPSTPWPRQRVSVTSAHATQEKYKNKTQQKHSDTQKPDMSCAVGNDEALSAGEHIPKLNIVTFWQTACQSWSVHREVTAAGRKCSDAALSSGDEICSASWKAARLQGRASVWAQRASGLKHNFQHCCGQIRDPKLEFSCRGKGRDKLMRQLSVNGRE